ncbi:MAG TPA: SGNH/GDSL hydrolase family protein [Planctomycetota bacterium]|nr:SGNH/GDSL hydrolase family protein [Planctomycetota bacterium]
MIYLLALSLALCQSATKKPFELVDGDRVVFIGNTFFERDLKYNHLETALTLRWPSRNVTFRNLGWDGDTVWGEARAEFGSPADGFNSLAKHVADLKPSVIFVAYGFSESYAGPGGIPAFIQQLDKMLDMLSRTQARIILLSPIRHEDLGRPFPDPAEHNSNLQLTCDAIAKVAGRRNYDYVNLFDLAGSKEQPLTENGIHLNDRGYRAAAWTIERSLGLAPLSWEVTLEGKDKALSAGTALAGADGTRFVATDTTLPAGGRTLRASWLPAGRHALRIDGAVVATASAEEWAKGVVISRGPEFEQLEKLRRLIEEKNRHYYHYWRPQNDTYIFGFRRKEQGHLTAEFPKYPPILNEKDAEIAKLRVPVAHTYVLERAQ